MMRFAFLFILASAALSSLHGQSSPSPDNTSAQAAAAETATAVAEPSPTVPESVEPPSLIPPNILPPPGTLPEIPSAPELQQLSTLFKQSSLGKAADEYRLHLQMTKLEVQIRNDQDLHDLKADAGRASTDLERRHRLRTYYERYYEKLRARTDSPDLKAYLTAQEANHELPLLQPRVRHQSDEAAAAELVKKRGDTASSTTAAPTPVQARASEALRP